jgi:tetratricopeptide (TPR) repeat protein
MQPSPKDWLVRTRNGEILGPFSQNDLLEELHKSTFSADDEIAPSGGRWVSAQALTHHDVEEFTRTSTRTSTRTHGPGASEDREDLEDLTPTPDFFSRPGRGEGPSSSETFSFPPNGWHRLAPFMVSFVALMVLWTVFQSLKAKKERLAEVPRPTLLASEGDSAFVQKIYEEIHAGQTKRALDELTKYHEKGPPLGDVEYLIPYAGLLISEKESLGRAKKMLDTVLTSAASATLKAHAHQWLGYLLLSQEEGDMGENHFLEALELNPRDAATRFNLGRAYLAQEKYSSALDYLQLAELEAPDLWLIHIYKGSVKLSLGNSEEARGSFKTALQSSPDRWIGYLFYALFLRGNHELESAQDILKKMLTRDPNYETETPPPFGFFQEKVNYAEYLKAFLQVMDHTSGEDYEVGKLYIGFLLGGPNSPEGKRLEGFAEKGGLTAKILVLKVLLDREASSEELKVALARLPPNLNPFGYYAYVLRAQVRTKLGLYDDAQGDLQKALLLEPKAAISHWALASVLKTVHHTADAQSELRHLLTYHPDYIPGIVSFQNF